MQNDEMKLYAMFLLQGLGAFDKALDRSPTPTHIVLCGRGGIGRRAALRSLWELNPVEVQVLSAAPLN